MIKQRKSGRGKKINYIIKRFLVLSLSFFFLKKGRMNDLGRGIVHDRSFPLLPPLLARKWSSWQVAEESTVLGEFLGWENSSPLSGQPWCVFARRGLGPEHLAVLLPVPTSVPGIGLGGRISDNVSWEDGSRGGMELPLAQPAWICSSSKPRLILLQDSADLCARSSQGAVFTDALLATRRVWVHPANPGC